jgi:hypothetical protein
VSNTGSTKTTSFHYAVLGGIFMNSYYIIRNGNRQAIEDADKGYW